MLDGARSAGIVRVVGARESERNNLRGLCMCMCMCMYLGNTPTRFPLLPAAPHLRLQLRQQHAFSARPRRVARDERRTRW